MGPTKQNLSRWALFVCDLVTSIHPAFQYDFGIRVTWTNIIVIDCLLHLTCDATALSGPVGIANLAHNGSQEPLVLFRKQSEYKRFPGESINININLLSS